MDRIGRDPGRAEHAHDLVGAVLGAAEHQHALGLLALQEQGQQRGLLRLVDHDHALVDAVGGLGDRSDRDFGRVGEIAVGKLLDRPRHGGREEQGLPLGRDQRDDPLQRMDEAEVEHLVGLVEDEDLELAQGQGALVDQVEQPARRGDEHVEAARDGAHALAVGNAAEDDSDRQPHEAAIGFGHPGDLRRQLAGRREDQHPDLAGLGNVTIGREPVERGQHEGRGLAGAGLGDAEQIPAAEHGGDRLALDRRRLRVILGRKRVEQGLGEPE